MTENVNQEAEELVAIVGHAARRLIKSLPDGQERPAPDPDLRARVNVKAAEMHAKARTEVRSKAHKPDKTPAKKER